MSQVKRDKSALAAVGLVVVTAIWGMTFVMVKEAVARMPVMDFLAVRFALATAIMIVARPRVLARLDAAGWRRGALLGAALGAAYIAQTYGLRYTSAAVSGFITGMFVVFTPLISGFVLRRRIGLTAWAAVAMATAGLALISLKGLAMGYGESLTLICAVIYAVHIVGLGEWSRGRDPYAFAVAQLLFVALFCGAAALPGGFTVPLDGVVWLALSVTAVLATAVAFVVQTWAQSIISPTRAAIVMTLEPVFAGLFAVVLGGEILGWRVVVGGILVVAAMYLVELGPRQAKEAEIAHLEI